MEKVILLIALVTLMVMSTPASAGLITVGSGWQEFYFSGVGSSWDLAFQFTLIEPGLLTVTDAFRSGDQFRVYDYAALLGDTSVPTIIGDSIGDDYDTASSDPRWSTRVFELASGTYDISGTVLLSPYSAGRAALKLDNAVPEPLTLCLFGSGLFGFFVRKKILA